MLVTDVQTGKPFNLRLDDDLEADLKRHRERFNCAHPRLEIRRISIAGGSIQYRNQCVRCGELTGSAIAHAKAPDDAQPPFEHVKNIWDKNKEQDYNKIIQLHVQMQKKKESNFWREYDIYRKTPAWASKRAKILARAGGVCEGCAEARATEVHHLTYRHLRNEFLFELVAICGSCHKSLHTAEEHYEPFAVRERYSDIEIPCGSCRWQSQTESITWCDKYSIDVRAALMGDGPCGPGAQGLEPLK